MAYKDLEKKKAYQKTHIEQHRKSCREYARRNRKKVVAISRKWYFEHLDEMKEYHKVYRGIYNPAHAEERAKYIHEYYIKNKERLNESKKIQQAKRWRTNLNFRITCNLRSRLNQAIKHNLKSKHTKELIGCTIDFLKQHLEKQFKPEMSWQNYGLYGWHIDHIKSCDSFDLSKEEEQRTCFHYTNLQPLWAEENLSKGAK
jgi:hypothetical protein